jgi:hydroxyethylthiazole kinase-like uncharacterized protein yjeF
MKVVNSQEMKSLDKKTIEELGIPSLVLMERASMGVYDIIKEKYNHILNSEKKALVIAGTGNNGADGLVVARLLFFYGKNVEVVLVGDSSKSTSENILQLSILNKLGVKYYNYNINELNNILKDIDIIIDAIFGVGLTRNLEGPYLTLVENLNTSKALKIAVDLPSGINADNGQIMGTALKVDESVTFAFLKRGLLSEQSLEYVGNVSVIDIGIPNNYANNIDVQYITPDFINNIKPSSRTKSSYKNTFGRVLLFGGSKYMSGAISLAIQSSLKSGVGLVNAIVPQDIHSIVASQVPCAMVADIDQKDNFIDISDSVVFGTGTGINDYSKKLLFSLMEKVDKPLLLDADALNILSENIELLEKRTNLTIITPHIGEMSRLIKISSKEIQKDKFKIAENFTKKYTNTILVLKGAKTIVAYQGKLYINSTGNPILAKGGSGDILSGLIGGLLAQKIEPLNAVILGVYLHGLAGDCAAKDISENTSTAIDIVNYINNAFLSTKNFV